MNGLSPLALLLISWSAVTAILLAMVIYRAIVGIHEDNQVFLDNAEAALEREQVETLKRIRTLDRYIKIVGIVSGVMLIAMAAIWVYQGFYGPQI